MTTMSMTRPLAFAALLALAGAPSAQAQADDAMLARLKSYMAEQGTTISWTGTDAHQNENGDEVTSLYQVTVSNQDKQQQISSVDLVNVEEEDGGWRIGSVVVPYLSITDGDTQVDLDGMNVDGMFLPAEGQEPDASKMTAAAGGALREMYVRIKDKDVFSMSDFHLEITPPENGDPMEFTGAAESFHVNLDQMQDEQARAAVGRMGYDKIDGYLEIEGSWNPADGHLSLARYNINVDKAGTFGISLELGGYTPGLIASLRKLQAQMAANKGGDNSSAGIAMLGLMQQLTFQSARIEFTDDSLTSRALDFVAEQQGARPADVANQAKALVPFAMMQLNNPQFTQMVTQAVSNFLDHPQNFAIIAEPAQPVPFAMIAAGAMGAPQTLPQQLGVKVVANE